MGPETRRPKEESIAPGPSGACKNRFGGFSFVVLFAVFALLLAAWPAYRHTTRTGVASLARPLLRKGGLMEKGHFDSASTDNKKTDSPDQGFLARYARSMGFRVQHFHVDSAMLREWNAEWNPVVRRGGQDLVMLSILLRQLPEAAAQKNPGALNNLSGCILELTAEGRGADPGNAIFWIAESLVLFYSGKDAAAIDALKQTVPCPRADAGLRDLNHSETAIWKTEQKPWTLFAVTPRIWGLELQRPLHALSRWLASQEKEALKKYNLERAVELALLQLELADRIANAAWTASDLATARAVADRAMAPFWTEKNVDPVSSRLEEHFASLLEDQGDKTTAAKFRSRMDQLASREKTVSTLLPAWRQIQQLASWNAPSLLGCLLLQTASLLLTLSAITFFSRSSTITLSAQHSALSTRLAFLAFAVAPLGWMILNWPSGGAYMLLGLVGSWLLWGGILKTGYSPSNSAIWKTSMASAAVLMLTATLLTTSALSLILEYRSHHLEAVLQHGWVD